MSDQLHEDSDRLPAETLAAYDVPAPSADLTDRYMERWHARDAAAAAPRRGRLVVAAAAFVAVGIGVGWMIGRPGATAKDDAPRAGEATVAERREIRMAGAIAVAEANAQVRWRVDDAGATHVEQLRGDVFYRVEPGPGFVVETAAGTVTTLGTCFRVETGANADVVTVYEGAVLVATAAGTKRIAAGEHVRATRTAIAGAGSGAATSAADAKIAELQARIARLEAEARLANPPPPQGYRNEFFEFPQDKLVEFANTCHVPYDVPPLSSSTLVERRLEAGYASLGFSADERRAVARTIEKLQPGYESELRGLYAELTGESGDALDALTLTLEIVQKSPTGEAAAAQRTIARERAGLTAPPRDGGGTAVERMLRTGIAIGDTFERALAREIPAARAREFRRTWGVINLGPSCGAR